MRSMMQGTTHLTLPVATTVLFAAVTLFAPPVEGQIADSYRLDGARVAVYNLAGRMDVVRGTGSQVVVHVDAQGRDADGLRVEVGEIRGRNALRVIYPDDRIVYPEMGRGSNTNQRVRADGTFSDGGSNRGDRYEIRGSGRGSEVYADIRVEVPPGRSIEVYVAAGEASAEDIDGDVSIDTGSGAVEVSGIRGALSVDTGSGSVRVSGVEGETSIDTGSGNVRVDDVRGGPILVDTGSGRVVGSDLAGPSIHVDTGSGSIELARVDSPDLYLATGSGSVELELLSDVERLDVDTGSGSVTVYLPDDVGADIELDSGSGGIDLDFQVELTTMRRNHIEGVIGDGQGRIRIDTGSGAIRLLRE